MTQQNRKPCRRGESVELPRTDQYPGLFAIGLGGGREIVAFGDGAEAVVRKAYAARKKRP